jgi:hypothetical protein
MSCRAAQGLVAAQGAVVFTTGPHTYERFVSGMRFCDRAETTEPGYAAAADTPRCFVAYRCKDRSADNFGSVN